MISSGRDNLDFGYITMLLSQTTYAFWWTLTQVAYYNPVNLKSSTGLGIYCVLRGYSSRMKRIITGVGFVSSIQELEITFFHNTLGARYNPIAEFLNPIKSIDLLEDWARSAVFAQRNAWSTLTKRKTVFMSDSCSPDGRELGCVSTFLHIFCVILVVYRPC